MKSFMFHLSLFSPHTYFVPRANCIHFQNRSWLCIDYSLFLEYISLIICLAKSCASFKTSINIFSPGSLSVYPSTTGTLLSCSFNALSVSHGPHHIEPNHLFGLVFPLRPIIFSYSSVFFPPRIQHKAGAQ